jgi:hypothetical protein
MVLIAAFFTKDELPKTGLSPVISIWRLSDKVKVVDNAAVGEVAGGWYSYDFAGFSTSERYATLADGGATLSNAERYVGNTLGEDTAIEKTSEALLLATRIIGLTQENFYIDQRISNPSGNLLSCRIRTYTIAGSVGTDSDVLATYTVTATYESNKLATYKVVKS